MSPKRNPSTSISRYHYIFIGLFIGFLIGISGNLIAAYIQNDLWDNTFTTSRIAFLVVTSLIGLLVGAWFVSRESSSFRRSKLQKSTSRFTGLRLFWSKLKSRGRGVEVDDVFSVGSVIDIDIGEDED